MSRNTEGRATRRFRKIHPGIYTASLPLPGEKPGPANVYLFTGETNALLDTGTSRTAGILEGALAGLGMTFADIDRLILTHGHIDHYGAASYVKKRSRGRCRVEAHGGDLYRINTGLEAPVGSTFGFLALMGVPPALRVSMLSIFLVFKALARKVRVDRILEDGDTVDVGNYTGRVLTTPGHTRGSICVHLESEGLLFAGDHILGHITPNALIMLDGTGPLPTRSPQDEFYASVRRVEKLAPRVVHPGHGAPVDDLTGIADMYRRTFAERQKTVLSLIDSRTSTVYAMSRRLFSRNIKGVRAPLELYLAVSEVYTHVQALETAGAVTTRVRNGILEVRTAG
ncbi:MAG: MBL fold metallo-hydrolase [Desulfatibacillaceae bacterium]